ncbi:hypothetical protein A1O1_04454 [Capronia coronata CBS 617.96]|uniref:Uncharacterized protein n=1 Tax=Capronia coronata CBS 617.96 TaxID=1182541 RepID=W9YER7_9EURO|nr:uncharacterized protein A1O1_04454 [Capronia coronata CBS 617.96]EXJ91342.1 hypothetical protein A1O1_04454 [Capronia coronata CBS 617.96]
MPQPDLVPLHPLEGFDIHPLWRIEAFRLENYVSLLPLPLLDKSQHDYLPALYERLEPALKLATLFLKIVLPALAKIRYAMFRTFGSGSQTVRILSDSWRVTDHKLQSFERELERMCRYYRITLIGAGERDVPDGHFETAITGCIGNDDNYPTSKPVIVQSAITIDWLRYLTSEGWDTTDATEKYSKYVLMATTLVHELAHAVWCHRMLPLLNVEYQYSGQVTFDRPEPRFMSTDGFEEMGYVIELQLFGGLLAFPHLGTPTTAENTVRQTPERLFLTIVDIDGRAAAVHELTTETIFSFFHPQTWARFGNHESPNFKLDLLPDIRRPGRHMSTVLSDPPPRDLAVPIIRSPRPDRLAGAITEFNELFQTFDVPFIRCLQPHQLKPAITEYNELFLVSTPR